MALAAYVGVVFMVDTIGRINFEEVSQYVIPTPPGYRRCLRDFEI